MTTVMCSDMENVILVVCGPGGWCHQTWCSAILFRIRWRWGMKCMIWFPFLSVSSHCATAADKIDRAGTLLFLSAIQHHLDIKSVENFLPCIWGNWATLSVINSSYFEFKMLSNWIKVLCKWVGRSGVQGDSTASITAYLHTKLWQSLHPSNNYVSAWPRTANTQQTWV